MVLILINKPPIKSQNKQITKKSSLFTKINTQKLVNLLSRQCLLLHRRLGQHLQLRLAQRHHRPHPFVGLVSDFLRGGQCRVLNERTPACELGRVRRELPEERGHSVVRGHFEGDVRGLTEVAAGARGHAVGSVDQFFGRVPGQGYFSGKIYRFVEEKNR